MGTYTGQDKRLQYLFQNGGGGGGTTVIANPQGQATDTLNKLQVGQTIYNVPSGGGGSISTYHANWTATATTGYEGALTDPVSLPSGKYIAVAHSPYSTQSGDMLYTLTANGTAIDNGNKSIYSNINYGQIIVFFELDSTANVAIASGTSLTNIRWDPTYIRRGGVDFIKIG